MSNWCLANGFSLSWWLVKTKDKWMIAKKGKHWRVGVK